MTINAHIETSKGSVRVILAERELTNGTEFRAVNLRTTRLRTMDALSLFGNVDIETLAILMDGDEGSPEYVEANEAFQNAIGAPIYADGMILPATMAVKLVAEGNERGRKSDWFAPRVTGRIDVAVDSDGEPSNIEFDEHGEPIPDVDGIVPEYAVVRITFEIKAEGGNPDTALLSVTGKYRSFGKGGGGRTAAQVTSIDSLFD